MNVSREKKVEKAVECMRKLKITDSCIQGFVGGRLTKFENYLGFWADEDIVNKVKEIEKQYNGVVYAITHEFTAFGEMYSFLWVPDYIEDWEYLVEKNGGFFNVDAYVWNKSDNDCSEFGTIGISARLGGIRRAW